jgi:tyrosyl-tRNA synthetase
MPDEMPELTIDCNGGEIKIANLLKDASLTGSTSDAFRMIKQGAVRIDGERIMDKGLSIAAGHTHVFQVGKRRFARVTVT